MALHFEINTSIVKCVFLYCDQDMTSLWSFGTYPGRRMSPYSKNSLYSTQSIIFILYKKSRILQV